MSKSKKQKQLLRFGDQEPPQSTTKKLKYCEIL